MRRSPLSRVERLIRRVVEEPFVWLSGGAIDPFQLAMHLAHHYEEHAGPDPLPNRFDVYLNPDDFAALSDRLPDYEVQVADYVALLAERMGHVPAEPPRVTFAVDPEAAQGRARVEAGHEAAGGPADTEIFAPGPGHAVMAAIRDADAFLIVQGRRHVPLDRSITRIGRRMDNDIVLDDPSVSRQHAQIRWRQPYFVLFDVSTHGRTWVNGVQAQEHILRPGDVIGLSDVLLVYGEGRDEVGGAAEREGYETDETLMKPEE